MPQPHDADHAASAPTTPPVPPRSFIAAPIVVLPDDPGEVDRALRLARYARQQGARLVEWRVDHLAEAPELVARLVRDSPLPAIVTCRHANEGGGFNGPEQGRIRLLQHLIRHAPPAYIDLEAAAIEASDLLQAFVGLPVSRRANEAVGRPTLADAEAEGVRLILSLHDFDSRPADLYQRMARMLDSVPRANVLKVAWMARSLRDNLEAFDLLDQRPQPMIALCMGPFGLPSRVLAPKFGGMVSFAPPGDASATAPGQPTIEELVDRLRFDRVGPATRVYGVIGWPVEHSASPDVHNCVFDETGWDGVYLPLPIPPEYEHFKATLLAFLAHDRLDLAGASVTLPHKEHALRFAREINGGPGASGTVHTARSGESAAPAPTAGAIPSSPVPAIEVVVDPLVHEIGSANTLVVRREAWPPTGAHEGAIDDVKDRGAAAARLAPSDTSPGDRRVVVELHNTDAPALVESALIGLGVEEKNATALAEGGDLRGLRVAVIGAGGVARAAVAAFSAGGATVVVYNRHDARARALAEAFRDRPVNSTATTGAGTGAREIRRRRVVAAAWDRLPRTCAHLIINCTPVGMQGGPDPDGIPVPGGESATATAEARLPEGFGMCRRLPSSPGSPASPDRPWEVPGPTVVFDTIYVPLRTPLLRAAEAAGLRTVSGLDMFVRQAARQSALWTGAVPDRDLIRRAAARRIFEQTEPMDDAMTDLTDGPV